MHGLFDVNTRDSVSFETYFFCGENVTLYMSYRFHLCSFLSSFVPIYYHKRRMEEPMFCTVLSEHLVILLGCGVLSFVKQNFVL
jgi:hypothetical protein